MKIFHKFLYPLLLVLLLALALPRPALAADQMRVVIGESFTLEDGETLDEDLIVIGGTVSLEEGSKVIGNVFVIGGSLDVSGLVEGDIAATGGYIRLHETAVVEGNVTAAGADIDQDEGAQVEGEINSEVDGPFKFSIPGPSRIPVVRVAFNPFWQAASFLARVFILSALAVLIAMFFPSQMDRVDKAVLSQPLISGGLGLFTLIIVPLVAVLMAITLVLIPVSLTGVLLIALLAVFGWLSLGLEVGSRLGLAIKQEWTPPLAAGIGTFVLTVIFGSLSYIQCIGWIFPLIAVCLGLGAVLLTRMGTRSFPEPVSGSSLTATLPSSESGSVDQN